MREVQRRSGVSLDEGGFGGEAEHFKEARLDPVGVGVDIVDAEIGLADAIAELLLSHGRFDDAQDGVGNFLRVARSAREKRGHFGGNLVGNAVGLAARFVSSVNEIAKNRCLVGAGFDDDGFDALGSKFVAIGFGKSFHGELAGGVERERGDDHTTSAAADVHQQAFAVAPHVWQHGAIHADAAHEVGVHDLLGLLCRDRFGKPDDAVARVIDGDVDPAGLRDCGSDRKFDGGVAGDIALKRENRE